MTYDEFKAVWDEFERLDREAEQYMAALLKGSPSHARGMDEFFGRAHRQVRPLMDQMSREFDRIDTKAGLGRPLSSDETKIIALRLLPDRNWQAKLNQLLNTPAGRQWYADLRKWIEQYG